MGQESHSSAEASDGRSAERPGDWAAAMFILALLDVSACTAQQTQLGLTLLECAKSAVEQLLDGRRKEGLAQRDQYMLVITADTPLQPHSDSHTQVVCGWHDNARFLTALKAVQPLAPQSDPPLALSSLSGSYLPAAITASLDLLNRYSRPNGIDNFARGRILNYNEPAMLVLLTTDTNHESVQAVPAAFKFAPSSLPASAYSTAPYRWDQRLFPVVLRLPLREEGGAVLRSASSMAANVIAGTRDAVSAAQYTAAVPASPLSMFLSSAAEQTGGKCFVATSFVTLLSHFNELSKRPCPNVLIHLTPLSSSTHPPSPRASSPWHYRSEFVGVYVKSVGVWPCPEVYLPDPVMQTLPPREPHPTFYFSNRLKQLPEALRDSAQPATSSASTSSSAAPPSIPVSSAPPPLPPLVSSIPVDSYTLDPSAPICKLLLSDESGTCRYVTAQPLPSTPPFGLLYADKQAKKAYLVLLPYDFPTFFSYLSLIDTHLRSLPLTSSSSAALTSKPGLYQEFAAFLSKLPFYYWPAVQAALGRMHRLPRLDVKMDVSVVGGVSAEVSERMRRWKEEAGRAMKEEKEAREVKDSKGKKEVTDSEQTEGKKKKRRRDNTNGEAAAGLAAAELVEDIKPRRRPLSSEEAEIEWLLAPSAAEDRPLLPPPLPPELPQAKEEKKNAWRVRGRVKVTDLFELSEEDVDSAMRQWRDRAMQLMQPFPLLAAALPAPSAPSSSFASPPALTLRPRLPPSASEPCHPIAVMGDFHTYLKSRPSPLRDAIDSSEDDASGMTLPAFGSPYRRHGRRGLTVNAGMDDDGEVEVNERDVAVIGGELQQTRGKGKWKPRLSLTDFVAMRSQEGKAADTIVQAAEPDDTAMSE